MAASKAVPLGHGPCPVRACNGTAFFKRSAGGQVRYSCTYCDSSGYADEGGIAASDWAKGATPRPAPAAEPAPPAAPAPAPASRTLLG